MRLLRRIERFFDKVPLAPKHKNLLNLEPLFLRMVRSQLRWFVHVSRMSQERLSKQALLAETKGKIC